VSRTELGRLLWHERDVLLQELSGLPPGQVDLGDFARRFRIMIAHRWPSVATAADPAEWRQALWSTPWPRWPCSAPSTSRPGCLRPRPGFTLTGTAPALVAAAMSGPEPPATLVAATEN
jgi:hypothetical protein